MNWLLKIVEGPLKGAEVALVDGRRVSLGSDDACDIVVGDAALAAQACELDVSGTGVTVLTPDGAATALKPFEVRTFGTTAFAVGPVDQPWGDLVYPPPEAPDAPAPAPSEPSADFVGNCPKSSFLAADAACKALRTDEGRIVRAGNENRH